MKKQALENIAQIWRKKQILENEINSVLGGYNLTSTAKDIYVYIAAEKACIAHIVHHSYFKNKSFSTIKRAVLELKQNNLITSIQDSFDQRVMWLVINEDK